MPVEIKELIIRAVAIEDRGRGRNRPGSQMSDDDKEAIIEACVRQTLRILKKARER